MITENLDVEKQLTDINGLWDKGFNAGYDNYHQPLPEFYKKPVYLLKPYEEGYWYGRITRAINEGMKG